MARMEQLTGRGTSVTRPPVGTGQPGRGSASPQRVAVGGVGRGSGDFDDEGAEVGPGGGSGVVTDAGGGGPGSGDLEGGAGVFEGPGFADVLAVAQAVGAGGEEGGEIDGDCRGGVAVEDGEGAEPAAGAGEGDEAGQRGRQRKLRIASGVGEVGDCVDEVAFGRFGLKIVEQEGAELNEGVVTDGGIQVGARIGIATELSPEFILPVAGEFKVGHAEAATGMKCVPTDDVIEDVEIFQVLSFCVEMSGVFSKFLEEEVAGDGLEAAKVVQAINGVAVGEGIGGAIAVVVDDILADFAGALEGPADAGIVDITDGAAEDAAADRIKHDALGVEVAIGTGIGEI